MSTAIVKVDGKLLAGATPGVDVTEEMAKAAMLHAGLPDDFDLLQFVNQRIVGFFMAKGSAGHIVADAVVSRTQMAATRAVLTAIIKSKDENVTVDARIAAAEALAKLVKAGADMAVVELKGAEIAVTGQKKDNKHSIAPQTHIRAKNVQLVQAPQNGGNGE